jgi:hypothetical protein
MANSTYIVRGSDMTGDEPKCIARSSDMAGFELTKASMYEVAQIKWLRAKKEWMDANDF